jgi:lysozyme
VLGGLEGLEGSQRAMSRQVVATGAAVIALVSAFVLKYEGSRNEAYWDPWGKVWTICEGHTGPDVKQGTVYTNDQCEAIRQKDIAIARGHVNRCLPMPKLVQIESALTDAAYNLGPQVVCGSTLQARALANDWPAACAELSRWDKAGGRVLPGLTRRRTDERGLCEGRALWDHA